jgi:hypothetical protein
LSDKKPHIARITDSEPRGTDADQDIRGAQSFRLCCRKKFPRTLLPFYLEANFCKAASYSSTASQDRKFWQSATASKKLNAVWEMALEAWSLKRGQELHQDFKDLLSVFADERVSYLLIGGYAVSYS